MVWEHTKRTDAPIYWELRSDNFLTALAISGNLA